MSEPPFSSPFVYPSSVATELPPSNNCPPIAEWTANELAQMRGRLLILALGALLGWLCLAWVYVAPIQVRLGETESSAGRLGQRTALGVLTGAATLLLVGVLIVLVSPGSSARVSYMTVVIAFLCLWFAALLFVLVYVLRSRPLSDTDHAVRYIGLSVSFVLFVLCLATFLIFMSPKMRHSWR